MTKHTPGPWHVAGQDQVQIRSEKHQIAKAWSFAGKTGQANARLIAAAPELLEALQMMLAEVIFTDTAGTDAARTILAKATGAPE